MKRIFSTTQPPGSGGKSGSGARWCRHARLAVLFILVFAIWSPGQDDQPPAAKAPREEAAPAALVETVIPYQDGEIVIQSLLQTSQKGLFRATGEVTVRFKDMRVQSDEVEYDANTHLINGQSRVVFRREDQEILCDRFVYDVEKRTGHFFGVLGQSGEEIRFRSEEVEKTGVSTYDFNRGIVTTCNLEYGHWHWSFGANSGRVIMDQTATLRGSVLRIFNIPVFYMPWVKFPILKKERKTGLKIPKVGYSSLKGYRFADSLYVVLGRSADITLEGDYYSKRGYGFGTALRTQFSEDSDFSMSTYSVADREDEGGTAVNVDSYFTFGSGYQGAIFANYVSNIKFRQVYDESYATAVRPDESLNIYLTKKWDDFTLNVNLDRSQYYLDDNQLLTRSNPEFSFYLLGRRLGNLPLYLFLDSSASGNYKNAKWHYQDPVTQHTTYFTFSTPAATVRADVFPRLLIPLNVLDFFKVSIQPALRATYYGDSLADAPRPPDKPVATTGEGIVRRYASVEVKIDAPRAFRIFNLGRTTFKHVVETSATWRWVSGVDNFRQLIQFDPMDAVTGTNEVEYSMVNRFITKRNGQPWEWAALTVSQKYFIDPEFSGNFRPGVENQIEPFFAFSPFDAAYQPRRFSPVQGLFNINLSQRLSGDVRAEYDTVHHGFRDWSVGATFREAALFMSVAYLRLQNPENTALDSNYLMTSAGIGRSRSGWSFDVNTANNLKNAHLDHLYFRLNYFTDCVGLSLEYINFDISTVRSENQVRFALYLKGLGEFGTPRNLQRRVY